MTTNQLVAMLFPTIPVVAGAVVALFIRKPWARRHSGVLSRPGPEPSLPRLRSCSMSGARFVTPNELCSTNAK